MATTFTPVAISPTCAVTPACNLVSNGWNSMTDFGNDVYAETQTYLDALYAQITPADLDVPVANLVVEFPRYYVGRSINWASSGCTHRFGPGFTSDTYIPHITVGSSTQRSGCSAVPGCLPNCESPG